MHKIERIGGKARLESDAILTPADFARIAEELGQEPIRARKIGYVAARKAKKRETIETHADGKETTNTAKAGDYIVTNLTPQRQPLRDGDGHMDHYVITADKFPALYESTSDTTENGAVYRAKGIVSALPFAGGLDILAPWGARQHADDGYLLLNGEEVYAAARDAFEATYESVGPSRQE